MAGGKANNWCSRALATPNAQLMCVPKQIVWCGFSVPGDRGRGGGGRMLVSSFAPPLLPPPTIHFLRIEGGYVPSLNFLREFLKYSLRNIMGIIMA